MTERKPIYVTQPYLPPLEEFVPYLREIWDTRILTNCGPFHGQFERALCGYLDVPYLSVFANGTMGLVTALQALRVSGEVITTPYSFVATSHALLWNGLKPVFVDIDGATLNLDPKKIEAAITPQTTAIVAVHVYGHPCDVETIGRIADLYNLKVIYDAAHAFGVRCKSGSIARHGDLSVLSFHATKVFNSFEGGAVVCPDEKTKQRLDHLKNFGFVDEVTVVAPGINGKMNEISAAFGLLQLQHIDAAIEQRAAIARRYRELLRDVVGITTVGDSGETRQNCAYFPILVGSDYPMERDALYFAMQRQQVFARRYFYPLISEFPMYRGLPSASRSNLPVANRIAKQVICLPIYPTLEMQEVERIAALIANGGRP